MDVRIPSRIAGAFALFASICGPAVVQAAPEEPVGIVQYPVVEPLLSLSTDVDQGTTPTVLENLAAELATVEDVSYYTPPAVSAPVMIAAQPALYAALPLLALIPFVYRYRRRYA